MAILGHYRKDASLSVSGNVSATAATKYSGVLDLGELDGQGLRREDFELGVTIPAITATQFPANTAVAFTLQSSNASDFSSGVVDHRKVSVTGGAAYAGATVTFKPSEHGERYWRVAATTTLTGSATTGTGASGLVFTLDYLA